MYAEFRSSFHEGCGHGPSLPSKSPWSADLMNLSFSLFPLGLLIGLMLEAPALTPSSKQEKNQTKSLRSTLAMKSQVFLVPFVNH